MSTLSQIVIASGAANLPPDQRSLNCADNA
jgi:hypothetical protein